MQFLVTTRDHGEVDWESEGALLEREARAVWESYKAGTIRNIWFTTKTKDAVMILECADESSARDFMDRLPLVIEGKIRYEIAGLEAYTGFERMMHGSSR